MYNVSKVLIRNILNSMGTYSIEAEIVLKTGETGIASASMAIRSGKREKMITSQIHEKIRIYNEQIQVLCGMVCDQTEWDKKLEKYISNWGTDITLSLSLAFARAVAIRMNVNLIDYLQMMSRNKTVEFKKIYLVPIFSGGVHDRVAPESIQQIMFAIESSDFQVTVDEILEFYGNLEKRIYNSGWLEGYSSSSGFLVKNLMINEQLYLLTEEICKSAFADHMSIALDVAAEHLKFSDRYHFYGEHLTADQMEGVLAQFTTNYPITYIEDPFDYNDRANWISLRKKIKGVCNIFSDDLTATQIEYIDTEIADGTIIKMKQVGTLSGTLKMIEKARDFNMMQCVSHRSNETEDSFMCDLGVAINAEYMKIGGPRRGDRVSKYNQLLRVFSRYNFWR